MTMSFTNATPLLGDPAALRRQARETGYLFLRNVVDADLVRDLRRGIFGILADFGCLDARAQPDDGIIAAEWLSNREDFYGSGVPERVYTRIQQLEALHRFPHQPRLVALQDALLGEPAIVHPGLIGRIILPDGFATPPHQDFVHTGGSPRTWTCWVPLGDVDRQLGSLSIFAGSHRNGLYPTKPKSHGGMEAIVPETAEDWAEGDFAIGDLLVFSGLTVHRALPNHSGNRVRLSVDFRFQPQSEPIAENCLRPHGNNQQWDGVYAGWQQTDLQYYWQKHDAGALGREAVPAG